MKKKLMKWLCVVGIVAIVGLAAYGCYLTITDWDRTCELAHKAYAELHYVAFTVHVAAVVLPIIAVLLVVIAISLIWKDRLEWLTELCAMLFLILSIPLALLCIWCMFGNAQEIGMRLRARRLAREARAAQQAAAQTNDTVRVEAK